MSTSPTRPKTLLENTIILTLLGLILVQPNFIFISLFGLGESLALVNFVLFTLLVLVVLMQLKNLRIHFLFSMIFLLQLTYLIAHSIHFNDFVENFAFISKIVITLGMITVFSLLKSKTSLVRLYVYAIAGLTLFGMLDFLISFVLDVTLLDYRFTEYGGHDFIFTGLTAYHEQKFTLSSFEMPRYSYFLNEPGTYVFFSFWALILNHLFVGSFKAENIILLGGVLTASLYFFITAILWFFIFRLSINKRNFFGISVIIVLGVALVPFVQAFSDVILFFWERNIYRLTNIGSGDNRASTFEILFEVLPQAFWFGMGRVIEIPGSSGLKFLGYYGFIGTLFLVTHIVTSLFFAFKSSRISQGMSVFLAFFFILTIAHREHIIEVPMLFFCFLLVYLCNQTRGVKEAI